MEEMKQNIKDNKSKLLTACQETAIYCFKKKKLLD
jgi:hypothetical protein